jgi:hypothetical protein
MYAFVVIAILAGAPQTIIMARGLTQAECEAKMALPDAGLRINGAKATGARRCISETDLPPAVNHLEGTTAPNA